MTRDELAAKVYWEGGVVDAIEYGIGVEDLPEDVPEEVAEAWWRIESALADIHLIDNWLFP